MSSMLEALMERVGRSKVPQYAKENFGFRARVAYSGEFRRIELLPRRIWDRSPYVEELVSLLTNELKTPAGTMELWKAQAAALNDCLLYDGAFLPVGVGEGKALISLLAPVVMEAERPILFVPASLRDQTNRKVVPEMSNHWRLFRSLPIYSYSALSLEKNAKLLEEYKPDLIILDECHEVKNKRAGRTRRLVRYFKENPATKCVAMSGTVSNRSLKDFAHIIEWCLKEGAPIPIKWNELTEWSDAIDEGIPEGQGVAPGALARFCEDGENVRQGFRRRLTETPGVVATKESKLGTSLVIQEKPLEVPSRVRDMIDHMRDTWTTPNGDIITEPVELWRHVRELALGFFYRWEPPAPRDWLDARREWKKEVREQIFKKRSGLFDTELQVWNHCKRESEAGSLPADHPWNDWSAIKDEFKPNSVPEWIEDFALEACREWLQENEGIVWTEHRAFGEKLGKHYPYFGAGDSSILDTSETAIVASVAAHGQGKNLQRFSNNLVSSPMTSGKSWEQLLGRTHRQGQAADVVVYEVFLHLPELRDSFRQAQNDATYLEDALGNRQKLNYANILIEENK